MAEDTDVTMADAPPPAPQDEELVLVTRSSWRTSSPWGSRSYERERP